MGKDIRENKGCRIALKCDELGSTILAITREVSAPNHRSKCILTELGKDHAKIRLHDIAVKNPA